MLVCPNCRSENMEEARLCHTCGRSLEGGEMVIRRLERREGQGAFIDFPPPKQPSAVPGIVGLVLLGVLLLGGTAWYLLRPDPCAGKFESTQFPYCLTVPRGWEAGAQPIQNTPTDVFAPQAALPFVFVTAESTPPEVDSAAYADVQRQGLEAGGLFPSRIEEDEVGGSEALAWEMTYTDTDGTVLRQRMVTLVRDGQAWQIVLVSTQQDFREARAELDSMLETWAWV
jgi:hypothetical protein